MLDAQYFGVAQRRRRVFIVGHSGGRPRPEVLALSEGLFGHPEPSREAGQDVAGTLEARTGGGGFPGTDFALAGGVQAYRQQRTTNYVEDEIASTVAARDYKDATDLIAFTQNQRDEVRDLNDLSGALAAEPGMKQQTYVMRQREGKPGGGKGPLLNHDQSLTLAANTNDQTLFQGSTVRRLTPLECARLQSFPDNWLEVDHADAAEAHARQVLQGMWLAACTETGEGRRPGVALALLTPEILLAGVYGGWIPWEVAGECATAHGTIKGANTWPEGFVRRMRIEAEHRPTPYRRESFEQLARELGRPLSELPLEETQAAAVLRRSGVWKEASTEWLVRHACSESETLGEPEHCSYQPAPLSDSAKYRAMGNAVAVPVVEWIMKRIADA